MLESKNVGDLASETVPSPYWINYDDSVRDWVASHSTIEIGTLSTASKIKMIQALMTGYVSDDEMEAIGRICQSVTNKAESEAIQKAINPLFVRRSC